MKLKSVKVFGFKTFADKTEIDLDGKIIAVVGPNGCGKSNIVDAILWGLGETNSRTLRAATGKEVIFAGSVHRRPLGFAEVSLLFDNEDGTLPVDSPEVLVTRRLSRSGESDYFINRRPCRLRDVNDLLADSGLGRAGYAIVGQSEIDQALAASAQQRRAWIDEAAGVQRYRARRTEAVRRLENAAEHLSRLDDILHEIENQRGPLEAEAEAARRFREVQATLRGIECGLLVQELDAAVTEIASLDDRVASARKLIDAEADRGTGLDNAIRSAQGQLESQDQELEDLRQRQSAAQSRLEHALASLQVAAHKLESLDMLEANWTEEATIGQGRLAEAESDVERTLLEAEQEAESLESLRQSLGGVSEEAKGLRRKLDELEAKVSAGRKLLAEQQKSEIESAHRRERLSLIRRELKGIDQTLPDLKEAVAEAEANFAGAESKTEAILARIRRAEQDIAELGKREETGGAAKRKLMGELAAAEGRRRGLEATIEAHEGLAQGSRSVLALVKRGELQGEYVPVGEVVEADETLALALDTALGAAGNDLIVPDDSYAKRAISLLKRDRLGRATFQPLTLMRPHSVTPDLRRVLSERGVVGLASELARCENRYRPVVESLLGRVVVTQDLDTALRLARTQGWSRMVTLEGEVVHSSGAVTGGASQRQGVGLVQRNAELTALQDEILALQSELAQAEKDGGGHESERAAFAAAKSAAEAELLAARHEHEEARGWLLNLRHELITTEKSQEKLTAEASQLALSDSGPSGIVDLAAIEAERDETLHLFAAKSGDAESASLRLREAEARARQAGQRLEDAQRRRENLLEAQSARQRRADNLEPEREKCRHAIEAAKSDSGREEAATVDLRARAQALLASRAALTASLEAWRDEAKSSEKTAASLAQTIYQAEIQRARTDARRTSMVERLLEEYGLDQEAALLQVGSHEVPSDAGTVVSRLRKELKAMGDVNLGAIEAYDRLNARHLELDGQVQDLVRGREEVEASIRELDRLTRDKFKDTFSKVQESFSKMYVHIFGGGEGSLELTEADNILDSGVEIQVTVPGKKRQRLELLSGGERAMSALAFLFALLQVRPSPLVVLDEVDAPLDGRNVDRFISVMREFHTDTQFILVTHNPVTIESADVWFGVTMQEPGVSTLVPFKLADRQRDLVISG